MFFHIFSYWHSSEDRQWSIWVAGHLSEACRCLTSILLKHNTPYESSLDDLPGTNEFVAHGNRFELLAYPGRTHSISEGDGIRKHLYTRMTEFLLRKLPPGPAK